MASGKQAPLRQREKGAIPLTWGDGGETFKWDKEGKELKGRYVGMKDGSMGGQLVGIDTGTKIEICSAPKVLADALDNVKVGTMVVIRYNGIQKARTEGGRDFKGFEAIAIPD